MQSETIDIREYSNGEILERKRNRNGVLEQMDQEIELVYDDDGVVDDIPNDTDLKKIDNLRAKVLSVVQKKNAVNSYIGNRHRNYKEVNNHANQVLFELIKEVTVNEWKENGKSIKAIAGSDTADEKSLQRALKYSNHYKTLHKEEYFDYFGKTVDELDVKKTPDGRERYSYSSNLSEYDVLQLKAMKELDILGRFTDRRITDVKKISNGRLDDDFQEYRNHFSALPEDTSKEFLLKSILIQTTEIKYHIEAIYRLASKMSQYNNCNSKEKLPDDFIDMAALLIANYRIDNKIFKENNLIFMQLQAIESIDPSNIIDVCDKYLAELTFSFQLKQTVKQNKDIMDIIRNTTLIQRQKFIRNYYNVISIYDEKPVWENKKESNFRKIVDRCVKKLEVPKIE